MTALPPPTSPLFTPLEATQSSTWGTFCCLCSVPLLSRLPLSLLELKAVGWVLAMKIIVLRTSLFSQGSACYIANYGSTGSFSDI